VSRWHTVKLAEIAKVSSGDGAPQEEDAFADIGKPFIRAGSLSALLGGALESNLEKVRPEEASKRRMTEFPAGTIVFAKSGMSSTKGIVHQLRQPALVVNHLAAIECGDLLESSFLRRWFEWNSPSRLISNPAYPSIKISTIRNTDIPLPPLPEQKRIAKILDAADALRAKRRESFAQLDTLLQSIFLEMFGDPVENPKGWSTAQLGELTTKIGSGATPRGGQESYKASGISLIRSLNVHDDNFRWRDLAFIDEEQAERLDNVTVEAQDVLLNITGASVARCCLAPLEALPARVNQHVAIIRPTSALSSKYVLALMLSPSMKRHLLRIAESGATRQAITKKQIEDLQVLVPPQRLQAKFDAVVDGVAHQRWLRIQKFTQLDGLFSSLQHRAFAGQL